MKNLDRAFLLAGLMSLSFLIGISSCDEGKSESDNKPTKQVIRTTLKDKVWKLKTEGKHVGQLNDYSFEFNNDGSVVALRDRAHVSGTWSTFSTDQQLTLNMEFAQQHDMFDALNDDWVIVETSDVRVVLVKMRGEHATLDKMTLEKVPS